MFAAVLLATAFSSEAKGDGAFIPAHSKAAGAQFAHVSFDSRDSELLLLLNPMTASGSASVVAPFVEYAYSDDKSFGLRVNWFSANALLDDLTLDLLNEGLQFSVDNIEGGMRTLGGSVFHRKYFGLDDKNRLAAFTEVALTLSRGRSSFGFADTFTNTLKANIAFSPGLMFFVMNNVSASCSLSMANVSFNSVKCFSDGEMVGEREKFGSHFGLDVMGINFGISFYL